MDEINLEEWVESESDPSRKTLREAMHIVLLAIATSRTLSYSMVMKGGVLLAIRYESTRFTKDIDFSTAVKYEDFNKEDFLAELSERLQSY
jgi:predicted nucleotidyltransferase component of viral defense system